MLSGRLCSRGQGRPDATPRRTSIVGLPLFCVPRVPAFLPGFLKVDSPKPKFKNTIVLDPRDQTAAAIRATMTEALKGAV